MAETKETTGTAVGPPLYQQVPPAFRQIGMLVAIAAAVAAGVALVLWSQSAPMTPLYTGLADRDASEIVAIVEGAGVEYRLDPATGSLLVPADRKYELRMQLASAGLPRGAGFGIEEIPGMSSMGQTPFMENALYTRAVETELARTISSIAAVDSARVHLALPPRSAFLRQQREPRASVLLTLFPGRRLDRGQVQGIVNLVAAAVPDLNPQQVAIADQNGNPLTRVGDEDSTSGLTSSQFEYTRQLEDAYAARIENLLAPVVGLERVRATVAADLDFTVTEETRETFDPDVTPVRSEQTTEETRTGGDGAQGVPGALSNQPPQAVAAQPAAAQPGQLAGPAAAPTSTSVTATRNFEIDKTISHIRQPVGAVRRLSIAVLLDYRPGGEDDGAAVSQEQLDSLTELARQAVGFDADRGDTITVHNAPFAEPPAIAEPEPMPLWQQPWVLDLAREGLGALLVLTLAFFVVRPMMRSLTRPQPLPASGELMLEGGQPGGAMLPQGAYGLPMGYEDRMAAARSVAGQDPRQVAQVVRNWVAQDDG